MMGQGDVAVRAGEDMAAIGAEEEGVKAPAVKKKEGLLPCGQGLPDRLDKGPGEKRRRPLFVPFRPQIDHLDGGQGSVVDPGREGTGSGNALRRRDNKVWIAGVADPRTTVARRTVPLPGPGPARCTGAVRPVCRRSHVLRPRRSISGFTGAKRADRAPTTTRTSPLRIRFH